MESLSMLKKTLIAVCLAAVMAGCATSEANRSVARIDAATTATADSSYRVMLNQLPEPKQMKLSLAVLVINMIGVNSAYEVVNKPELQSPSVGRIKDLVAGMSADEIIAFAAKNSTVRIEVPRQ
jgi:hypothetical protein